MSWNPPLPFCAGVPSGKSWIRLSTYKTHVTTHALYHPRIVQIQVQQGIIVIINGVFDFLLDTVNSKHRKNSFPWTFSQIHIQSS